MRPATERELADVRDTPCGREFGVLRMSVSEDGATSRILFGKVKSDAQEHPERPRRSLVVARAEKHEQNRTPLSSEQKDKRP